MALLDGLRKLLPLGSEKGPAEKTDLERMDETKSEIELFNFIKSKVDEVRSSATRIAHEGVWMQNCAYTIGFAGVFFNTSSRTYQPLNRNATSLKKSRLYVNKILPNLQNRLAKLTKNPPRFDVRPNGMEQDEKDQARLKLDVLTCKWDDLKLNLKRQELLMYTQECGHGYFGVFWDDTAGAWVNDPITGEETNEGDIRIEVISPFEIFPDPLAKNFEEAQYFIRAKVRPLEYFRDHYGEKGAEVKEEDCWLLSAQFDARLNTMNTRGFSSSNAASQIRHSAIELTYFEKPSRKYKKGRMIVGANGVVLKDAELPVGKIPLVKFDDIIVAGKYYPEAVVTHVRPMQDQYNQVVRRRADWTNKLLAGKYISPRGNELIREALTDESAEIVQYTVVPNAPNGGEPKHLDIPMIPQYAYNEEEKLDSQFSEVMGISEVSKGQLPSASIPALGMQILVEADDTRIGVEILGLEFGYAKTGELILDYVQHFYKTPRKMKFMGKNALVVKDISGEDIPGENDVIVMPGSTIPGSKALRRQEILNTYSQGLLGDPADPKVREYVLGLIEEGDVGEMFIDTALNAHRSKQEIEMIQAEMLPDVAEEFDHPYHLRELARFRKSEKFDELSDLSKENYELVKEEHLRWLGALTGAIPDGASEMEESDAMAQEANATQSLEPEESLPVAPTPEQEPAV